MVPTDLSLSSVIYAPITGSPVSSVTLPVMVTCAYAPTAESNDTKESSKIFSSDFFIKLVF